MTQDELDLQCARWGHQDRKVAFCDNALCPGRSPAELVDLDGVPDVTSELEQIADVNTRPPDPAKA